MVGLAEGDLAMVVVVAWRDGLVGGAGFGLGG